MTRPCDCNRCSLDPFRPYTTDQCRLCWLFHHIDEYHTLWSSRLRFSGPPCRHLAAQIEAVACPTCTAKVRLKVFTCEIHARCTLETVLPNIECCKYCLDYK
jgi:hypothetical protein